MESFDQPVGLGVIGGGRVQVCAQEVVHCPPELGDELGASVRCHLAWNSKTGDPILDVGFCYCLSFDVFDGYYFWPACKTING